MFNSEKTAIKRNKLSAPARYVIEHIIPMFYIDSILDWGCGYGSDIEYYRHNIISNMAMPNDFVTKSCAQGYDPNPKFEFVNKPNRMYSLITCNYVLNVVPNYYEVVEDMLLYLEKNGLIFLTSRSKSSIDYFARKGKWDSIKFYRMPSVTLDNIDPSQPMVQEFNGWISSKSKQTFQTGLTISDYENIAKEFNLRFIPLNNCKISGAVSALMMRKIKK